MFFLTLYVLPVNLYIFCKLQRFSSLLNGFKKQPSIQIKELSAELNSWNKRAT